LWKSFNTLIPVNYKLSFLKIIAASLYFAWTNKAEFLRAISIPTLALVVLWGVWLTYSAELPGYLSWLFLLGYGLSFSFLAVTCHRLILIGDADRYRYFKARPGYRELRFLAWVIVIYALKSILEWIAQVLVQYVGGDALSEIGGDISDWVKQIASIPALYVLARLSLAFPAVAIDRNPSLRWSWIRTRGNGWRIFVVVGLFPWLADMLIGFVWREDATVWEEVVLSILTFVGLAIEIIALSFTYKELAKQYVHSGQSESGEIKPTLAECSRDSFYELAQDGKGQKLFIAVKVAVVFMIGYLFIGSLGLLFIDCSSELVSSATSLDGAYKAELYNTTCKDDKEREGLFLEIVKTTTPKTIRRYTISKTVSREVDLVWKSDKSLVVRHTKSLYLADVPKMIDDIQIVIE
jgi:hypothetical protein